MSDFAGKTYDQTVDMVRRNPEKYPNPAMMVASSDMLARKLADGKPAYRVVGETYPDDAGSNNFLFDEDPKYDEAFNKALAGLEEAKKDQPEPAGKPGDGSREFWGIGEEDV